MAKKVGIEIEVDSKGAITSFKQLGKTGEEAAQKIDKESKKATRSLNLLAGIGIAGVFAGTLKLGKSVIELSDQYSLLRSQIRLVIDEGNNLESIQSKLLEVSNETRQSVKSTTELYTKLDRATKELSLTDEKVIDLVETLNKAFIISGASAEESSSGVRQLSQAIQGGILRAEEYNSIIEQTPRIAELFAASLKVTQGEFRKLVIEGKVTTKQLIGAIQGQSDAINDEFGKIQKTSGQTWVVLTNNAESYITKLSEVNALQGVFNSLLEFVSDRFVDLNQAKTLEIAQKTAFENRTLEQQKTILDDLLERKKTANKFDEAVIRNLERSIIVRKSELEFIEARTAAQEELNKKSQEENAQKKVDADALLAQNLLAQLEKDADERNMLVDQKLQEQNAIYNIRNEERRESEVKAEIEFQKKIFESQQAFEAKKGAMRSRASQNENDISKATSDFKRELNEGDARVAIQSFKEIFGESKALASAEIILSTAIGIQKSFELLPPFDFIRAGIVGASGVAQLAKVNGAKYADGTEFVNGGGTNRSDSVPAMLSRGERVVDAQTNAQLGGVSNSDLLSAVNGNGGNTYITINAGIGSDPTKIAQAIENYRGISRDKNQRPEPII